MHVATVGSCGGRNVGLSATAASWWRLHLRGRGRSAASDAVLHVACRKEQLWPHVREFADRGISHVAAMLRRLQEASEPCSLYTIHGAPPQPLVPDPRRTVQHNSLSVTRATPSCLCTMHGVHPVPPTTLSSAPHRAFLRNTLSQTLWTPPGMAPVRKSCAILHRTKYHVYLVPGLVRRAYPDSLHSATAPKGGMKTRDCTIGYC